MNLLCLGSVSGSLVEREREACMYVWQVVKSPSGIAPWTTELFTPWVHGVLFVNLRDSSRAVACCCSQQAWAAWRVETE